MKKVLKSVLGATLAVSMLLGFTACSSSDDKGTKTDVVTPTSPKNKLVIKSNVSATFQLGLGSTKKTGTEVEFNPTGKGIVTVSAPGRVTKVIEYDFTDTEYMEFEVTLESKSNEVAQADAEAGKEVNNAGNNQTETGISAAISFNGQKNTNPDVTNPYSITAFTPMESVPELEEASSQSVTFSEPVIAFDCQPTGARFAQPITLNMNIPGSEGLELFATYEGEESAKKLTQNGANVSIDVDHFSVWSVGLRANVRLVKEEDVEYTASTNANTGSISVAFDYGFEESTNRQFIRHFLRKSYIPKARKSRNFTFPSIEGTARLKLTQKKRTFSLTSGNQVIDFTVNGETKSELTIEHPEGTVIPTHNGGSN